MERFGNSHWSVEQIPLYIFTIFSILTRFLYKVRLINVSFFFSLVLIEGNILGQERSPATLYDPRIVEMPLDSLYHRFETIPVSCYYPLIQIKSKTIAKSEPPSYNATGLPLIIKERDPEYQFQRVILFRRLLYVRIYYANTLLYIIKNVKRIRIQFFNAFFEMFHALKRTVRQFQK